MSRRPVHPRAYLQLLAFTAAMVATAFAISYVRGAAPTRTLDVTAPQPQFEVIECERTLPDAPEGFEEEQLVDPVGLVRSVEVLNCPQAFDGQFVVYIGEVVGDVLRRDGGAWVLMNDDDYALELGPLHAHQEFRGTNSGLSVWLPDPLPDLVEEPGRAGQRGDVLQVRGILHRTDPADGGGLTIRARDAELIARWQPIDTPVNVPQAVVAGFFALIALVVTVVERRVARAR